MIKLVYCFKRREDLSHEQFIKYWVNAHTPIAKKIPGVRKYVQSHALHGAEQNREPDFDGMAELWFDSVEAIASARLSPEWAASTADEANFINLDKVAYFLSEEREVPV